jgi:TPR repeat protein
MSQDDHFVRLTAAVFLILFLLPSLSFAYDYQSGWSAYAQKDYEAALKLWQPLADQGSVEVQEDIGGLYEKGLGVKQNYAEAYFWYSLAARAGNTKAIAARDEVMSLLTAKQQAAVKGRVLEWMRMQPGRDPQKLKEDDATADAKKAIAAGDFRLVGVYGYSVEVPGAPTDDWFEVKSKYGIRMIEGTSDTESGPEEEAFNNNARSYARKYNEVILKAHPVPLSAKQPGSTAAPSGK